MEGGRDSHGEGRALFVPYAVLVRCEDTEAIISRAQVGVERLAARARVEPVLVETFEHVAEVHAFGNRHARGRVVELDIGGSDRKRKGAFRRVGSARGAHGLHEYRGRDGVAVYSLRIDLHDAICEREPELAVRRLDSGRQRTQLL